MIERVIVYSAVLAWTLVFVSGEATAQAVTIHGQDPEARDCYFSAQRSVDLGTTSAQALESCTTALERGNLTIKDRAATHVNRGILNTALLDYEAASADYDAAMGFYPGYGAIYVNRGNIFFLGESYADAIDEYTKALDAEMSEYQIAHLNRGMAHEQLGHYRDAEADYRRALALAPAWPLAETKLARVLDKMH